MTHTDLNQKTECHSKLKKKHNQNLQLYNLQCQHKTFLLLTTTGAIDLNIGRIIFTFFWPISPYKLRGDSFFKGYIRLGCNKTRSVN